MQFQIPQFIERELKIVGPLTFKQFLFVGGAGLFCVIFYIVFASRSFLLFIAMAIITVAASLALAFVKIGGKNLPTVMVNFLGFLASSRVYLWRKKAVLPKIVYKPKIEEKKAAKKEVPLKMVEGGKLQDLSTKLEIGIR